LCLVWRSPRGAAGGVPYARMIDPILETPAGRHALAAHDIGAVYQLLVGAGIPQRKIATVTGQSQSQVSDILHGRRTVMSIDLLERVAAGLGVPPGWVGVAYTGQPDDDPPGEVDEDMMRRAFLLAAGAAIVGNRPALAEALQLMPNRSDAPTPLPRQLGEGDVAALSDLTERMRALARQYGGQADAVATVAARSTELMHVPAEPVTRAALGSALSELHTLAGWTAFDSGLPRDTSREHFQRGMDLAAGCGDTYRVCNAVYHAAMTVQNDDPDNSLRLLQMAQARLGYDREHPRSDALRSWLHVDSAHALLALDRRKQAVSELAASRDGWDTDDRFDAADMNHVLAKAQLKMGRLESAEALAAASVDTWGPTERRDAVQAETTLAVIRLRSGDARGVTMARQVVEDVAGLRSVRARKKLEPLLAELDGRSTREARELAAHARRTAAVVA
jgi:transcriptional regulator with XRE-family HTH domain